MQATPGASLTPEGDVPVFVPDATSQLPTRKFGLLAAAAGVAWAVDVVTKVVAVETLSDRPPVEVVPGVLDLTLTRNPGAAFSIGPGLTVVLTVVAVVVVGVVLRLAVRVRDRLWAIALGLLLGGALGNLTDRLAREPGPFQGHVVDFLRLPNWPVFNVADSCIVVAAVLIGVQAIRGIGLDGTRPQAADPPSAE
ncbi:MAG: signal peptidase II [Nocardioidaceae bacterium]|nr:signal peptidase II [Nocardioidaceae bacterium]